MDSSNLTSYDTYSTINSTAMEVNETLGNNYTDITSAEKPFYYCKTDSWSNLNINYKAIHGGSSLVVCVFGSLTNIINIIVLTRRNMISSTNAILTALALTDMLVMAEYIPYTLHQYILTRRSRESMYSYGWTAFVLFHAHFGQVFHTISISLTLTLAVWRYIAIACPQNNTYWCSMDRAKVAIAACLGFSIVFNIPNYINLTMKESSLQNTSIYLVAFVYDVNTAVFKVNFIVYSVILKLLPCIALTLLSFGLIQELLKAARRRAALMKRPTNGKKDSDKQADRVTKMLLAILILFLISEFPQGILGLLYILPNSSFTYCYVYLGELMDMLVLFNSAVNFVLYCSMSKQFRDTFVELFTPNCLSVINRKITAWRDLRSAAHIESVAESNNTCVTHV